MDQLRLDLSVIFILKEMVEIVDSLDVYEFLFKSSEHKDIYLQDGDYILVSSAGNLVEVKGEINRPYTYEVKNSDNLKDLIECWWLYFKSLKISLRLKRFENEGLLVHDVHQKDLSKTKLKSMMRLL